MNDYFHESVKKIKIEGDQSISLKRNNNDRIGLEMLMGACCLKPF